MVSRNYLTNFFSHSLSICIATVKFPRQFNCIKNLRLINIYILVLHALQYQYPQKQIVSDGGASKKGTMFQSRHVRSYATANIRGIKYGPSTHHRGKKCCYAYIHGRAAAQIEYILSVSIPQESSPAIKSNIAIIRRFQEVQNKPLMPWSLWCVNHYNLANKIFLTLFSREADLGVNLWQHGKLGDLEAVQLDSISGQFVFGTFRGPRHIRYWVTISLDTVSWHIVMLFHH
jgi:hypothetical protein